MLRCFTGCAAPVSPRPPETGTPQEDRIGRVEESTTAMRQQIDHVVDGVTSAHRRANGMSRGLVHLYDDMLAQTVNCDTALAEIGAIRDDIDGIRRSMLFVRAEGQQANGVVETRLRRMQLQANHNRFDLERFSERLGRVSAGIERERNAAGRNRETLATAFARMRSLEERIRTLERLNSEPGV